MLATAELRELVSATGELTHLERLRQERLFLSNLRSHSPFPFHRDASAFRLVRPRIHGLCYERSSLKAFREPAPFEKSYPSPFLCFTHEY